MVRKVKKPRGSMEPTCATAAQPISVLIADSNQMQCQLLVGALRCRPEFRVVFCSADMNLMLNAIAASSVQVAILNNDHPTNGRPDMTMLRRLHLALPEVAKILLLGSYDRDLVANAFRSGAKGLFAFSEYPFRLLCKRIFRSEEHTSELQSRPHLVCRLLLEKKKRNHYAGTN